MIIVQNIKREILSTHTTVSAYAAYYKVNTTMWKYVRARVRAAEGKTVKYKKHYITKTNPKK